MGFELFQRKQQVFSDLIQAAEKIKELLPELTQEERLAFLDGIRSFVDFAEVAPAGRRNRHDDKQSPAKVVEAILREHPEGIRAAEILRLAEGKVETESDDEKSIIYSAIAYLKKSGKAYQNETKEYFLKYPSDFSGKTAIECCFTILSEAGKPLSALTIAREALARGYVGEANGSRDAIEMTTAKSFWARMCRDERFEKVEGEGETFKIREESLF